MLDLNMDEAALQDMLDTMIEDDVSPALKAAYLNDLLDRIDISRALWRKSGADPEAIGRFKPCKASSVIDVTPCDMEGRPDGDPVYLRFQNKKVRDMSDRVTRFDLPSAWPVDKIAQVLVSTSVLTRTVDSSFPEAQVFPETVKEALADRVWNGDLKEDDLKGWVSGLTVTRVKKLMKQGWITQDDLAAYHHPAHSLAVAMLFEDPTNERFSMGHGVDLHVEINHTNDVTMPGSMVEVWFESPDGLETEHVMVNDTTWTGMGADHRVSGLAWIFTACAALLSSGNMSNEQSASEIDEVEEEFLDRLEEFESASDDPVYQAFFDAVVRSPLESPERSFKGLLKLTKSRALKGMTQFRSKSDEIHRLIDQLKLDGLSQ